MFLQPPSEKALAWRPASPWGLYDIVGNVSEKHVVTPLSFPTHRPTPEALELELAFLEYWLKPGKDSARGSARQEDCDSQPSRHDAVGAADRSQGQEKKDSRLL